MESKDKEIDELNKQIVGLQLPLPLLSAKISSGWEENFSTTGSARKDDESWAVLESKNIKIKELEKNVNELKAEKEKLKERVKALEAKVKSLNTQVVALKGKNLELEGKIMCFEEQLEEVKEESSPLKKNLRDLTTIQKNVHDLTTNNDSLERKVEHLQRKIHESDDDLVLGELCRRVQSKIFQKILLAELYYDRGSYKIQNMGRYFWELFKGDERKINAAYQTWAELRKELKWEERDAAEMGEVMKWIQKGRNKLADPELTVEMVTASTQRLKDAGRLTGLINPNNIQEMVRVWKRLEIMA